MADQDGRERTQTVRGTKAADEQKTRQIQQLRQQGGERAVERQLGAGAGNTAEGRYAAQREARRKQALRARREQAAQSRDTPARTR